MSMGCLSISHCLYGLFEHMVRLTIRVLQAMRQLSAIWVWNQSGDNTIRIPLESETTQNVLGVNVHGALLTSPRRRTHTYIVLLQFPDGNQ